MGQPSWTQHTETAAQLKHVAPPPMHINTQSCLHQALGFAFPQMPFSLLCVNRSCLRVNRTSATTTLPTLLQYSGLSVHSKTTAVSVLGGLARMSKKSSTRSHSSSSSHKIPSTSGGGQSSNKKNDALPTERQKTLNRFLGLPLEERQTRVDSLFRKQATSTLAVQAAVRSFTSKAGTTASSTAREIMEIDGSSDVEEVNIISKTNGTFHYH